MTKKRKKPSAGAAEFLLGIGPAEGRSEPDRELRVVLDAERAGRNAEEDVPERDQSDQGKECEEPIAGGALVHALNPGGDILNRLEEFRDFRNFLYYIWTHVGLPPPTEVQYDMAIWLQHGPKRRMVKGFRGVGKSWMTAAYAVWCLYWNPDIKILLVSGAKRYADDLSTFMLQIIRTVPGLQFLDCAGRERHSKLAFDVGPAIPSKQASVTSVGMTGQITGARADLIIPDDIETLSNALTDTGRDTLRIRMKEFEAVLSPGGDVVILGTPQTEDSVYNDLLSKGYAIREWPAEYPDQETIRRRPHLAPLIAKRATEQPSLVGHSTEPLRFSDEDLEGRKLSYGRSDYARQFLLDTSLDDSLRYPLKLRDLVIYPCEGDAVPDDMHWTGLNDRRTEHPNVGLRGDGFFTPQVSPQTAMSPFTGSALFVDPAGTGSDETAVSVGRHSHGRIFIPEVTGYAGGYTDAVLTAIAETAKRFKCNAIVVEANFGDGMFTKLLQPHVQRIWPCLIEEVKVTTQKERRIIDTLEPVMNQHRLIVDPRVLLRDASLRRDVGDEHAARYSLFYQMTRITADRGALAHDDRLDSLAGLVAFWLEVFARDVSKSAQTAQDSAWRKNTLGNVIDWYDFKKQPQGRLGGLAANAACRTPRHSRGLRLPAGKKPTHFSWQAPAEVRHR